MQSMATGAASKMMAALQAEAERAGSAQARAAAGAAADPLEGLDLAPLHRCLHLHVAMGRQPQFADYYRDNRRQQLASDLTPPANFIDAYQPFLAQVRTILFGHAWSAQAVTVRALFVELTTTG